MQGGGRTWLPWLQSLFIVAYMLLLMAKCKICPRFGKVMSNWISFGAGTPAVGQCFRMQSPLSRCSWALQPICCLFTPKIAIPASSYTSPSFSSSLSYTKWFHHKYHLRHLWCLSNATIRQGNYFFFLPGKWIEPNQLILKSRFMPEVAQGGGGVTWNTGMKRDYRFVSWWDQKLQLKLYLSIRST